MRIAIAEVVQETDSFSPIVADLKDFEAYGLFFGNEILERVGDAGPIGGLREVAAAQHESVEYLPILRAWGGAGGTITAAAFAYLKERLVMGLKQVLPVDAVFLSLHGAAAAENEDDVEGNLLRAVRELVGPQTPIVVVLDHHANVTELMVRSAEVLIGHDTQPHDPFDTGRKAARVLFRLLRGDIKPAIAWRKIPLITPQDQFLTAQGPMKEWFDLAREMETRPGVIDVSPYPMQPWLDVAEGGWAVVAHTDNNPELADSLAAEMAAKAWDLRAEFWKSDRTAPAEAVRQAVAAPSGLIILSDTGDSVYGGAPGESTCILRQLLEQQIPGIALVPLVDRVALETALAAGVGNQVSLDLGGKVDRVFNQPVHVAARVIATSQGLTVDLQDRGICEIGRSALLAAGQMRIVLLELRTFAINHPLLYTHLGLDIADAKMVVVKTASNFQFFQRWRKGLIRVDSPGTTQSDLTAFDWKRVPRPIYPLDELATWDATRS